MARVKTTLMVDEELMRRVRVKAARTGKTHSDILEEALRQGLDPFERVRMKVRLAEADALAVAGAALEETRKDRRAPRDTITRTRRN